MADQFERVGLIAAVEGIQQYLRDVEKIEKGQDRIQKETRETERVTSKATKKINADWNKVGRNMLLVGGAIAAVLGFAAKSAIDFESAMGDVRKTVDEGEPGFARLEAGINAMARRLPIAREEIARTLAAAGQLGIEGVDNLLAFTEVAIGLGISTDLSAEQASFALAQLFNVTGQGQEDIDNIGSAIVELGNNTATTESRILNFAQRIAASGTNVGLTTEEILALSATVLSLGVNTERGATQVSNGFISIQKAVADGGDELEQFAKISGVSAEEFADLWAKDALGAFELFIQGVGRSGRGAITFLQSVGLDGIRAVEVFQALGRAQDNLSTNIDLANEASRENVALAEEVARRNATTASQIKIAWNEIKIAFGEAGETLLPLIELGIKLLKLFLQAWEAIPAPIRTMGIAIAIVAAATGIFGFALIKVIGFLGGVSISAIQGATAVTFFGRSLSLAIPIIGLFIAAVAAITFGLLAMGDATSETDKRMQEATALRKRIDLFKELGESFQPVIDNSGKFIKVLDNEEERLAALADGTGRVIDLTMAQAEAVLALVDKNVPFQEALLLIITSLEMERLALDETSEGTRRGRQAQASYNEALRLGAEASGLTVGQLTQLTENYIENADATDEAADGTAEMTTELEKASDAARQAAEDIAKLSGRAFALRIAADRISGANIDQGIFALGGQFAADIIQAQNDALFEQLVVKVKLDAATVELADSLFAEAQAMAGVTEEANKLGGAAERIALAFDDAVDSIERARAQMALGILIDELRAAGGNEEALALALLLADVEGASGRAITQGISAIARLFPEISGDVRPESLTEGGEIDRGVALLLQLLGGRLSGASLPSFQTGGLVTGGRRDAPLLAQLHVGEFVIPADRVQALLGPLAQEGSGRGDVNFTANYYELESPVRVRDDLEALRLQGVF